jgi:hypothetical protein
MRPRRRPSYVELAAPELKAGRPAAGPTPHNRVLHMSRITWSAT